MSAGAADGTLSPLVSPVQRGVAVAAVWLRGVLAPCAVSSSSPSPTSTRYFFVSFSQVCVCCRYHTRFVLAVFLGMGIAGQSATCFLENFEGSCTDSLESGLVAGGVPVGCGHPH